MNSEQIEKDILDKAENALHNAAYEIAFEIESAYESAVDAFYGSYTPRYYDRNYYTYTGSDSYDNYSEHVNTRRVRKTFFETTAGIKVSGEYVKGSYHDPTSYVFERSYAKGIHGTIGTGGQMSVSPERLMQKSFDKIKGNLGSYIKKYL